MNYTEIARKFNEENGRTIAWDECVLYFNKHEAYSNMHLLYTDAANLFAESVRLEERRKMLDFIEKLRKQSFDGWTGTEMNTYLMALRTISENLENGK